MSDQPNPEEMADAMDGYDASEASDMGAEGAIPSPDPDPRPRSNYGTILQALTSSEPHEPLETIDSPLDLKNGAEKRIFRGVKKMASVEGQPAWLDLAIGMMELLLRERFGIDRDDQDDQDDQPGEQQQLSPDERLDQFRRNG